MSDNMENRSDLEQEDTLESPETIQETTNAPVAETKTESEEYSLNDDRRVKVLSRALWWPSAFSATASPLPAL